MSDAFLLTREQRWHCPNCSLTQVTHEVRPHTEMHHCGGHNGLWSPMVPADVHAKVTPILREDYVGTDIPQRDGEGNVYQSVVIERDDGQDCAVLAPSIGRLVME